MILCADLHLRHDRPIARKDDYFFTQSKKFITLLELARKSPPLIVAGDLFDKARPPIPLIRWVMDKLIDYVDVPVYVTPGQHDLPLHNLKYLPASGLGLLEAAGLIKTIVDPHKPYQIKNLTIIGCPFGVALPEEVNDVEGLAILAIHHMVIQSKDLWPGQCGQTAQNLLKRFPRFDFIVTGDNHRTFIESSRRRHLINSGSLLRMSINQQNHHPCVYDTEKQGFVYFPIEEDVFDLERAADIDNRDNRILSFIEHLETGYEVSINFKKNLQIVMERNKTVLPVQKIILECIGEMRE